MQYKLFVPALLLTAALHAQVGGSLLVQAQRVDCAGQTNDFAFHYDEFAYGDDSGRVRAEGDVTGTRQGASTRTFGEASLAEARIVVQLLADANACPGLTSPARADYNGGVSDQLYFSIPGAAAGAVTVIPFRWWIRTRMQPGDEARLSGERSIRIFGATSGTEIDAPFPWQQSIFNRDEEKELSGEIRIRGDQGLVLLEMKARALIEPLYNHPEIAVSTETYFLLGPLPQGVSCQSGLGVFAGCDGPPVTPPAQAPTPGDNPSEPPIGGGPLESIFEISNTIELPVDEPICQLCGDPTPFPAKAQYVAQQNGQCRNIASQIHASSRIKAEVEALQGIKHRFDEAESFWDSRVASVLKLFSLGAASSPKQAAQSFAIDEAAEKFLNDEQADVVQGLSGGTYSAFVAPGTAPIQAIAGGAEAVGGAGTRMIARKNKCDPPDPNFELVAERPDVELDFGLAAQHGERFAPVDGAFAIWGYGLQSYELAVVSLERYQGAVLSGDAAAARRQADATGQYLTEADDAMLRAADAFEALTPLFVELAASVEPSDPAATLSELQRVVTEEGLPGDLVSRLLAVGLDEEDVANLEARILKAEPAHGVIPFGALPALMADLARLMAFSNVLSAVADSDAGRPAVWPASVANASSFTVGAAPGSIVSLFGAALAPGLAVANDSTLPSGLEGVEVRIDGTPVPLFFVSAGQVNFQLPYTVQGPSVAIELFRDGAGSGEHSLAVSRAAPGVFTADQSGRGQAIVTFANSTVFAAPESWPGDSRPAKAGDALTLYASGLGAVVPPISAGSNSCDGPCAADFSNLTLRRLEQTPKVELGGVAVPDEDILFAGLTPQFAGLYQINFFVPSDAPSGPNIPIVIRNEAASSRGDVTIAIE